MNNQACSGCYFQRSGECHKSPPVRLPRRFDDSATQGNRVRDETMIWGWPAVAPTDWCGEWKLG